MTHKQHSSGSFSDDRLRILKNIELTQTAPVYLSHTELESLLSRLEAAEHYCDQVGRSVQHPEWDPFAKQSWLKSAGRVEE